MHVATVPAIADDTAFLSLVLRMPPTAETAPVTPRAHLGGVELELSPAGLVAGHPLFVTERLPATPNRRSLAIETPPWMSARRGEMTVAMYVWR